MSNPNEYMKQHGIVFQNCCEMQAVDALIQKDMWIGHSPGSESTGRHNDAESTHGGV